MVPNYVDAPKPASQHVQTRCVPKLGLNCLFVAGAPHPCLSQLARYGSAWPVRAHLSDSVWTAPAATGLNPQCHEPKNTHT